MLGAVAVLSVLLAACGSSGDSGGSGGTAGTSSDTTDGGSTHLTVAERPAGTPASTEKVPNLNVGFAFQISNLDQSAADGRFGAWAADLALEQVMVIAEDGKLIPWLAEEVTQKGDTVYEYHLRKGIKFSDGNELTADDVAFSWNYDRRPTSVVASDYASVKSIEVADPLTVVVTLKEPDAAWKFTPALESSQVFEKKFYEEHKDTYGKPGTLVVGTGPWKFDSLDPTSGAELSANPSYWGGPPPIERISMKFFSDESSLALAMRGGQIDIAPNVADAKEFESTSGGVELTPGPSCLTAFFSMPTKTAPWNDVHVRRAVAHALNRDDVITASGFFAEPAETLIARNQMLRLGSEAEVDSALESLPSYALDLEAAKEELAKSKYPDGFSTTLVTFDYGSFLPVDQVIAQQLGEIGIDVKIDNAGQNGWFAAVTGPADKRPLTYTTSGLCTPDPSYYDFFLGSDTLAEGGFNIANYAPPEVDKLIKEGVEVQEPAKRLEIYTELLDNLATNLPYIPLFLQEVAFASDKFEWPGYDVNWHNRVWALDLVPR